MRRRLLGLVIALACGVLSSSAQPPQHPPGPLGGLLPPPRHPRPVPANAQHTPTQLFDASNLGSPMVLDKSWRVGVTADPAAANVDYDDSTWAVRNADEAIADVDDEDHHGEPPEGTGPPAGADHRGAGRKDTGHKRSFVWFRIHIKLAQNHGPVALMIELPISQSTPLSAGTEGPPVDVFANGREIHPEGPHGDDPEHYQAISRVYKLNVDPTETSVTVALRSIYVPFGYGTYTAFFATRKFRLGNLDDLNRSLELWSVHSLFERLPRVVNAILLVALALFLFALYFTQRGHREYLWLALHELVQAPLIFVDLAGNTAHIEQLWYGATMVQLVVISAYLYFEFLVAFLALRPRWYIRWMRYTAPILLGVGPSVLILNHNNASVVFLVVVYVGSFIWILAWLLLCFITLIAATVRRNFEAGLLLIPLVLSFVGMLEPMLTTGMKGWTGKAYHSPLTIQAGPVPIHFASIADFIGLLVIVLIIFVRFLRIHRDQERASSELAAARSVQELMIPQERLKTPGFEVDSVYNPANEVGGDFYHVEPTADGGLLVVIGDVAGHGLKAAMNVSMLMGALRRISDSSPAKILESLNRVLVGSESFTTCQAAWFGSNGECILANAGHLPPYLNSQEIAVPGSLPLGVLPENTYEEIRLYLHPGDRLLLLSDGVVEARHSSGELFGFDRMYNLSNQSAFYIADAAKSFGQEDDITVVTIRRLAEAMAA